MESVNISTSGASQLASPWAYEIRRRWTHLRELIIETEADLTLLSRSPEETADLEASLRLLKHGALSVWVDAQRAGVELPGASGDRPGALAEG